MRKLLLLILLILMSSLVYADYSWDTANWDNYWSMDNIDVSSSILYDSKGSFNGTIDSGVTTGGDGQIDEYFQFDGTTSAQVVLGDYEVPQSGLSISIWWNSTANDVYQYLLTQWHDSGMSFLIGLDGRDTRERILFFTFDGNSQSSLVWDPASISEYDDMFDGSWHHLVVTISSSGNKELIIDGISFHNSTGQTYPQDISSYYIDMIIGARMNYDGYEMIGGIDDIAIWSEILNYTQINEIYNQGLEKRRLDQFSLNISNVVCTSPTPDDDTEPYTTDDTTPTFYLDTNLETRCKIDNQNISFDSMTVNCSSRTASYPSMNHSCTLSSEDELGSTGTNYVYIACSDGSLNASIELETYIIPANETEAKTAIESGINSALTSPTITTAQQMYIRYSSGAQSLARFDKVAEKDNVYYAFNYITSGESNSTIDNLGSSFYVWQNWSLTEAQITAQVEAFINNLI